MVGQRNAQGSVWPRSSLQGGSRVGGDEPVGVKMEGGETRDENGDAQTDHMGGGVRFWIDQVVATTYTASRASDDFSSLQKAINNGETVTATFWD